MFEAILKEASILKKLIDAIKDMVEEANFDCTPSGISLQAMDSVHVSLVAIHLRAGDFEKYRCDKNMSLGVNLLNLAKILKCASNSDTLKIKAEEKGDHVSFIFENKNKIANFDLKLLDIESEHLGIPDTQYKAIVKMPASEFQKICRDMNMLSDSVTIAATKQGIRFSVTGQISDASTLVKNVSDVDDEHTTTIDLEEDVTLTFALKYLLYFTKATGLSDHVTLSMSPEVPLVTEYAIEALGYIRYYLAPKIEDDES
eukprot:TRINITY_DN6874_c0_g1_i1.p1 TRINITY_DN6874_c0_g1~~TRINITY_DN6874_c0_g1_i1.p1  ORF type:complete len:258 (-),score=56.65 TRINITY_DN6874_c0_g1_i1:40-813(-)